MYYYNLTILSLMDYLKLIIYLCTKQVFLCYYFLKKNQLSPSHFSTFLFQVLIALQTACIGYQVALRVS